MRTMPATTIGDLASMIGCAATIRASGESCAGLARSPGVAVATSCTSLAALSSIIIVPYRARPGILRRPAHPTVKYPEKFQEMLRPSVKLLTAFAARTVGRAKRAARARVLSAGTLRFARPTHLQRLAIGRKHA